MKSPIQNQECPYEAGTNACFTATWTHYDPRMAVNPCMHCDWWEEFRREDDDD